MSGASRTLLARLEAAAERRDLPVPGGHASWRIWGAGPPLALFHGAYGSWRHWTRTLALADRFTLLVPDLPGYGTSSMPADSDPEAYTTSVGAELAALVPADAPLTIAGFSFGGRIAGRIAADWRGRLERLVLIAPGGLPFPPAPLPSRPARAAAETEDGRRERLRLVLSQLMIADPAQIDKLAVTIQDLNTRESRFRPTMNDAPIDAAIRRIEAPVIGLWGSSDAFAGSTSQARADHLAETARAGCGTVLAGAGHWLMHERPKTVNAVLAGGDLSSAPGAPPHPPRP